MTRIELTDEVVKRLRANARAAGISGARGGWIYAPGRGRPIAQGWYGVALWARRVVGRYNFPENLREIAEGRRVGRPTLCVDDADQLAAGLLSESAPSWRTLPPALAHVGETP